MNPTNLMIEQLEAAKMPLPQGIRNRERRLKYCNITEVEIADEEGAALIGRPCGHYMTLETEKSYEIGEPAFEEIAKELSEAIAKMLGGKRRILVVGIGNPAITPDSLGKKAIDRMMVTRPMKNLPKKYSSVSAIAAPVFGESGIESYELVKGILEQIHPEAVILIDALATGNLHRLCKTVQLADVGLAPGAGVGNARPALDAQSLGCPVVSIGMPTVLDCRALLRQVIGEEREDYMDALHPFEESLIAVPRQMELATDMGARIIAFALNKALQGNPSTEEILRYLY